MSAKPWSPPFCANEAEDLLCPACGENGVRVREKETYYDGDTAEAYCCDCHVDLEVCVSVTVSFDTPEVVQP